MKISLLGSFFSLLRRSVPLYARSVEVLLFRQRNWNELRREAKNNTEEVHID